MFGISLLYPGSLDDQQNGFQIITLIISAPIIFLNAWEWQQPESLDNLIPPNFKSSGTAPNRIDLPGKIFLAVTGGLVLIWLGMIIFGLLRKPGGSQASQFPGPTLDISVIQTAAVETALAAAGQNLTREVTPLVTESPAATQNPPGTRLVPGTPQPLGTKGPLSTNTVKPDTIILQPIETPTLLGAPTDFPILMTFTGTGNKVIDFQKWDGPAIVEVIYNGTGTFVVTKNSSPAAPNEQFINKTGSYNGSLPIDFLTSEYTSQFGVTTIGQWKIQIIHPSGARTEIVPTTITGNGDDVVYLTGLVPDQLTLDASQATGIFTVHGYRSGIWDLIAKETAPYTGTLTAAAGVTVLQITATGVWSIGVTGK